MVQEFDLVLQHPSALQGIAWVSTVALGTGHQQETCILERPFLRRDHATAPRVLG